MTRIQYCFLALCGWTWILLTNTRMKTFGDLWNWLIWRTLYHPFLINWIMSVLRVVRTSGRSKKVCAGLNCECACESSKAPAPYENLGRQLENSLCWPGNQPTRFYSTCFQLLSLGIWNNLRNRLNAGRFASLGSLGKHLSSSSYSKEAVHLLFPPYQGFIYSICRNHLKSSPQHCINSVNQPDAVMLKPLVFCYYIARIWGGCSFRCC